MKIILNLEKIVEVESIEDAQLLHERYWNHPDNSWLRDIDGRYDSIILNDNMPTYYLSPNSRIWDWDDVETMKTMGSVYSNPFTNGSDCCNVWNARKNRLIKQEEIA